MTAPTEAGAGVAKSGWNKQKPTSPGIYGVRGFNIGRPPSKQSEAIVRVCKFRGKLVCNLHEYNSDEPSDSWSLLSDMASYFEWREYVVKATGSRP